MKKTKDKATPVRLYTHAECLLEDMGGDDGPATRVLKLRIRTLEIGQGGETASALPWVTLPLEAVAHLGRQLIDIAAKAGGWVPGQPLPDFGSDAITRLARPDEEDRNDKPH